MQPADLPAAAPDHTPASPDVAGRATPRSMRPGEHPGRIGYYQILDVLGEGGMGVVYLAEQTEPVRRQVALKILKPGMDTRQVVTRFESERQSLAVMEHPSIAKVFDAGATETGRPYFVMELVDGTPITEYCDAQGLGLRERVRLFAQVCRAVQHAHQKGVIHRDLKPSNVLVTESDGEPLCKIIDFGIARAIEQDAEQHTRLTQHEQSIGTPAYMSPEQAIGSGLDIDTRTDIYSLGVLFYELLTGVLPFDPQAYQGWAFYAHHLTKDPPRPSARFAALPPAGQTGLAERRGGSPDAVRRALGGDLDWIGMRALEKERERRYQTANSFALDLERHLAHEPVLASPPSTAYTARKFVRRHRVGVAFGAVVAVLLVAFAIGMAIQADRVAQARDLAVARQGQAEELIGFMLGDLWEKLEPVGRLEILDDVGDRAVAYFGQVSPDALSDPELSSRSRMLYNIGSVRMRQGNLAEAIRAFEESLRLARELSAREPDDPQRLYDLGQSEFWVGYGYWSETNFAAAARHFEAYREVALELVRQDSTNVEWLKELGYSYANLAWVADALGDIPLAVEQFRRGLVTKNRVLATDPENLDLQYDVARGHYDLAHALRAHGELMAAQDELEADLAIKQKLLGLQPANTVWRQMLASSLHLRAELLAAVGHHSDALESLHIADSQLEGLLASDSSNRQWQRDRAFGDLRRAELLLEVGRLEEAGRLLLPASTAMESLTSDDERRLEHRRDLARARYVDALLALHQGQPARAVSLARSSSELLTQSADHGGRLLVLDRARALVLEGRAHAAAGDRARARAAWEEAAAVAAPHVERSDDPRALASAVEAWMELERRDEAAALLVRLRRTGYHDPRLAERARTLGYTY